MVNMPQLDVDSYFEEDSETVAPKHGTTVQSGWDLAAKLLKQTERDNSLPIDYKWEENAQLVFFPEDEPFFAFNQHWIEREGKKSFTCVASPSFEDDAQDCPLCTVLGDNPRFRAVFNVVPLSVEQPTMQILYSGVQFYRQIDAINQDPRLGPLTKHFWSLSRKGKGLQTEFFINRVKATDLVEDWGIDPTKVAQQVSGLKPFDKSFLQVPTIEELKEVAKSAAS
jgi:hypothetical protein